MPQGIIFDFDGLIVDTELPEYQSWQEIYQSYGCSLPISEWVALIGAGYVSGQFDPYAFLEKQLGQPVDREAIREKRRQRSAELQSSQPILPGVEACISDAKRLGVRLGIASSSPHHWVDGHLARLRLGHHFECIKCADDVAKTKPDPELYLSALDALQLAPAQAIALEDSPNGILAAKRAGIFCVAVPNPMTSQLSFDQADLVLSSLAELSVEELLAKALVSP
ncbi:MAG: HAD family hydrolase [Chloroflexota bacterium]|nr:MAG: HAD family hydrolase [Chloroflexota bacterium]